MRIVIVAGEVSGDILGAGLIKAIKQQSDEDIEFVGIGGDRMIAAGLQSLFAMERLSVMGLVEPLKRLPELLSIRKAIKQLCVDQQVDCFIGIDSPDFNLNIEKFTRKHGIKTLHYVSPSVWAWRQGRIKGIKKSVDKMLTLLPFEADFYKQHQVPVSFVGHPLADDIAMDTDTYQARQQLSLSDIENKHVIALMPGSRGGEVRLLGELFLDVAVRIQARLNNCVFLIPAANAERKKQIQLQIAALEADIDIRIFDGMSHEVMAASDAILLASGTTALEAMLFKKPMVVAYKMAALSFAIISRLVKSKYISLPNLLADDALVPEFIQDDASIENLSEAILKPLEDKEYKEKQVAAFYDLHRSIQKDASSTAAKNVLELIHGR